mmetsp:Transcript_10906/g.17475  ORF Transcript_10906/g.17475 Transcript_10906/m.17475 type:complete len:98 (-) Transcript_10906:48-341(-)
MACFDASNPKSAHHLDTDSILFCSNAMVALGLDAVFATSVSSHSPNDENAVEDIVEWKRSNHKRSRQPQPTSETLTASVSESHSFTTSTNPHFTLAK